MNQLLLSTALLLILFCQQTKTMADTSLVLKEQQSQESVSITRWQDLPDEIKALIVEFLSGIENYKNFKNLVLVNKEFKALLEIPQIFAYFIASFIKSKPAIAKKAFFKAVINNYPMTKAFLKAGINPNLKDERGLPALMHTSDRKTVELLLQNNADVNLHDNNGESLIEVAAKSANSEMISLLFETGAPINVQSCSKAFLHAVHNHDTCSAQLFLKNGVHDDHAFISAVEEQDPEMIKLLLSSNANVNAQDQDGKTALLKELDRWGLVNLISNHDNIAKMLLEAGADVTIEDNKGNTALLAATKNDKTTIIPLLLERGALVDRNTSSKALVVAAYASNIELIKLLLQEGADVNFQDENGRTALLEILDWSRFFSLSDHTETIVKILLDAGADINILDLKNNCPLGVAADKRSFQIVRMLTEKGAQGNQAAYSKALVRSAENCDLKLVKEFLAKGADVNFKDKNGDVALLKILQYHSFLSFFDDSAEIARLLIAAGAHNIANPSGTTPLHVAIENSKHELVHLLCQSKLNINARDSEGQTALMLAIKNNDVTSVQLLLNTNSVKTDIKNKKGETALYLAKINKNQQIIDLLKSYCAYDDGKIIPEEPHFSCMLSESCTVQ